MTQQAAKTPYEDRHYLERELDELVRRNRIWQHIRAGSLDGVWYRDLENPQHEWISPESWKLLGMDPATGVHAPSSWQEFVHPDDLETAIRNFSAHCADTGHPYDQVMRHRHADGSTVWIRCRGMAIRDASGRPVRMLGAHTDVTRLKQAEERATRANCDAHEANEELRAFAYSASHDLKSPANTIRMLLQEARLALQSGVPSDADAMLSKAETTNEAMREMVDKLLEYTCLMGAKVAHAPVDLDRVLPEVIESLGADITGTGAEIALHPLGKVFGSEWQIRQLFQNLISNGIKFQPAANVPRIDIRAFRSPRKRLIIEVADNGIGIAATDRNRVFDLFTALHDRSRFPGTGIGLAFCARVAKAHGGEISVTSNGPGARFSLDLPICESAAA
jgi:PAS domain S-box-containing protein